MRLSFKPKTLRVGLHETCGLWTFSQRSNVKTAWQKLAVGRGGGLAAEGPSHGTTSTMVNPTLYRLSRTSG